jgi:hypothetical protein
MSVQALAGRRQRASQRNVDGFWRTRSRLSTSMTASVVIAAVIVRDPLAHETIMLRHRSRVNVVFDLGS